MQKRQPEFPGGSGSELKETPGAKPRRRGRSALVVLTLLALAAAGAWWLTSRAPRDQQAASRPADTSVTVQVGPVTRGAMPVTLDALGTVTSAATVTVKTQISGKILEVGFQEGQFVNKGDFLVQIDPRPYQATLDQAQGQLTRDEALLAQAKLDLTRYETLLKQDSIARQQVDTQRALVRQNEAVRRSDTAAVENASINLNYCRIVSPINGRVGLQLVDPGNYVQPSDPTGVVVVTQTKPISVIFPLAQDTIPQFIDKLRNGVDLPVHAYSRNSTTLLATGKLDAVDNQIDTTTGTVKLRAMFPNDKEELFPNQFVNVKLVVDTLKDAILAPHAAIQLGAPGTYVYVVNDNSTVSVRPVKVGPSDTRNVVILDGLAPDDKVVLDGADRLRDGAKVTISDSSKTNEPIADDTSRDKPASSREGKL